MYIIQHTTDWIKSELFEGKLVLLFRILTCFCAFLFYKIGMTPNAKALLFLLLLMTIATYVVDHFSEERAATYYQHLKSYASNN